jgi:hypothetical protein
MKRLPRKSAVTLKLTAPDLGKPAERLSVRQMLSVPVLDKHVARPSVTPKQRHNATVPVKHAAKFAAQPQLSPRPSPKTRRISHVVKPKHNALAQDKPAGKRREKLRLRPMHNATVLDRLAERLREMRMR